MNSYANAQQQTELEQVRIAVFNAYNVYYDLLYYENECKANAEKYNEISANYYRLFISEQLSSNYQAAWIYYRLGADYLNIAKYYESQIRLTHTQVLEAWRDYYLLLQRYIYLRDHPP